MVVHEKVIPTRQVASAQPLLRIDSNDARSRMIPERYALRHCSAGSRELTLVSQFNGPRDFGTLIVHAICFAA